MMQNVAPSHALVRRSRQLLVFAFLTVAIGTFLAVVGIALWVITLAPKANETLPFIRNVVFILGVLIALGGLAMAIRAVTWKTDNDLAMITGKFLEDHFDSRFTFIRNISRLGLGYIDAVLVGPPGVLVFRILDNDGVFFNETSKWLRQTGKGDWAPLRFNPTEQVVVDIKKLREYLAKRSLPNMPVFGVIAFVLPENMVQVSAEKPTVPSAQLSHLVDALSNNYTAKDRIDAQTVAAIVKTLY